MNAPLSTADRIRKIVAGHLDLDVAQVTDNAKFMDDLNADSLDVVELIMAFEEDFDVEISDDLAVEVMTVGQAVALIDKLCGVAA